MLLTKILHREGSYRWQFERVKRTGETEQRAIPIPSDPSHLYADSETLKRVIRRGREADRSDIDAFVLAIRAAHHPKGAEFLLDVIRNPVDRPGLGTSRFDDETRKSHGKWKDNIGGSWSDAKFHAAVGLAELGSHEGVEWLIRNSRRNRDIGPKSISRFPHSGDTRGNYRMSSLHALADISGLGFNDDASVWSAWWIENKEDFEAIRSVSLRNR